MKRFVGILLILTMLLSVSLPAPAEETTTEITLSVGEAYEISEAAIGAWDNDAPAVAAVDDSFIVALSEGTASILMISDAGSITYFHVTVTAAAEKQEALSPGAPLPVADDVPASIRAAIELALAEWQENLGKTFSRLGSKNKFSRWQCGTGSGCNIGWCGAFVGYCLDNAGVPMDGHKESVPHEDGTPYAVRAAGVGKIYTGYQNMKRLSDTPAPGSLVIYGKKGGYAYLHVGMVTAVTALGDDTYIIQTVEGNVSNRIKRYCYFYDKNGGKKNFQACPEEYQTSPDVFQYTPHDKDWMITAFCLTWF